MKPTKNRDAAVEFVDVLLREGTVLSADVLITVADVPLVGVRLRLLLAGMTTMTEHGVFADWDASERRRACDVAGSVDGPTADADQI